MLRLRNPHAVQAALQMRPAAVKSIQVPSAKISTGWQQVVEQAGGLGIAVTRQRSQPAPQKRPRRTDRTERTGGCSALVEPPSPVPLKRLLKAAGEAGELWLALEQVQDPQNLGALFRLAGFFGVQGVVMTKDRTAPVNDTVCDVSVGGAEYVPWTVVPNLAQAFKPIQEAGVWVVGTCERAEQSVRDLPRDRPWMLVLGNEGEGLKRLTRERCDQLCALPASGRVPSLNVATAAAACLTVLSDVPS